MEAREARGEIPRRGPEAGIEVRAVQGARSWCSAVDPSSESGRRRHRWGPDTLETPEDPPKHSAHPALRRPSTAHHLPIGQ
jgi:hypothetical protein